MRTNRQVLEGSHKITRAIFTGPNTPYQGHGGAISMTGDLTISYTTFQNYSAVNEGGAIYITGSGDFIGNSCCFYYCYVHFITNNYGGNCFTVYGHNVDLTHFHAMQCGSDDAPGGDSTWFVRTSPTASVTSTNITHCIAYNGGSGGAYHSPATAALLKWQTLSHSIDHNMLEAWSGTLVVEDSCFIACEPYECVFYANAAVMTLRRCHFESVPNLPLGKVANPVYNVYECTGSLPVLDISDLVSTSTMQLGRGRPKLHAV